MATLEQARAAIISRVKAHWAAAYPAVNMYYDNAFPADAEVDALSEYALCSIEFAGGAQMDISENPNHRTPGNIVFTALCREGAGSSKVLRYLDSLSSAMKFAQFSGVTTREPRMGRPHTEGGWFSYDLSIPFTIDSIS